MEHSQEISNSISHLSSSFLESEFESPRSSELTTNVPKNISRYRLDLELTPTPCVLNHVTPDECITAKKVRLLLNTFELPVLDSISDINIPRDTLTVEMHHLNEGLVTAVPVTEESATPSLSELNTTFIGNFRTPNISIDESDKSIYSNSDLDGCLKKTIRF